MLVEITGLNKMYTTKRYKRAHSVLNLKVLSTCLARRKIFENVGFFFFILSDLDPYLLSYIYIWRYTRFEKI